MKILSARYVTADHTAVILETDEAGSIAASECDTPEFWAFLPWGVEVAPYVPPPAPPKMFFARDLIDQLTVDDLAAIETAVQQSPALRLLWLRLRTREGKPVVAEGESFAQGWAGLSAALGADRAKVIGAALDIAG